MLKLIKWAVIAILVLVVAFIVVGLVLPKDYNVERSVTIDAPPEVVFAYLNDLEKWETWEPFSKADSSIVTTRGDVTRGIGATQSWTGDSGNGKLTFTSSDPESGIAYDLNFEGFDPSTSAMTFEVVDGKTVLTWTMEGTISTPVIGGYFVMMMDSMVGPMYEDGLDRIKTTSEADPVTDEDEVHNDEDGNEE